MSSENKITEQQLFDQLISSLVHSAWVFMGKIKNPINDKLDKDLDQASIQIDMLDMLFKRMKGNLSENEDQYLGHLIGELKMNFVEVKNEKTEEPTIDEKHETEDDSSESENGGKETDDNATDEDKKNVKEKPEKDPEGSNDNETENSEDEE